MNTFKSYAYALRDHFSCVNGVPLKSGQALELSVSAHSNYSSWNHVPQNLRTAPVVAAESFNEVSQRLSNLFWRIQELSLFPSRAQCAGFTLEAAYYLGLFDEENLEKIRKESSVNPLATFINNDIQSVDFHNAFHMALEHYLKMNFYEQRCRSLGSYYWDIVEQTALDMTFSTAQASLIRSLVREVFQHSWPLEMFIMFGLFDRSPIRFLQSLSCWPNWETAFETYLELDGTHPAGF